MISLASRTCPVINPAVTDTTRKAKSSTRPMVLPSSHKKNRLPGSVPSTMKKHTASQVHFSEKKTNCISSALKGRYVQESNLFAEAYIHVFKYPIKTFIYFFI